MTCGGMADAEVVAAGAVLPAQQPDRTVAEIDGIAADCAAFLQPAIEEGGRRHVADGDPGPAPGRGVGVGAVDQIDVMHRHLPRLELDIPSGRRIELLRPDRLPQHQVGAILLHMGV